MNSLIFLLRGRMLVRVQVWFLGRFEWTLDCERGGWDWTIQSRMKMSEDFYLFIYFLIYWIVQMVVGWITSLKYSRDGVCFFSYLLLKSSSVWCNVLDVYCNEKYESSVFSMHSDSWSSKSILRYFSSLK